MIDASTLRDFQYQLRMMALREGRTDPESRLYRIIEYVAGDGGHGRIHAIRLPFATALSKALEMISTHATSRFVLDPDEETSGDIQ